MLALAQLQDDGMGSAAGGMGPLADYDGDATMDDGSDALELAVTILTPPIQVPDGEDAGAGEAFRFDNLPHLHIVVTEACFGTASVASKDVMVGTKGFWDMWQSYPTRHRQ